MKDKCLIAIVGMPGAGKSEVIGYLTKKGIASVRFGQITEDGLQAQGLPITPENEQQFREKLRRDEGMDAYAKKAKSQIDSLLEKESVIAIDGLYSWEEYLTLTKTYDNIVVVAVVADAQRRYERLSKRMVRPFTRQEARQRDVAEIEQLHKAGPIAIADYYLENNEDEKESLYKKVEEVLNKI